MTPERLGPCRLEEVIGQGPLTIVYRAVQEPLGRRVAVKALRGTIAPSSPLASRLEREAHLLASLAHPGVLALHEFVRTDDAMWLVLEYVDGPTLAALLAASPRGLEPAAALGIAIALADALAHAHGHGIVHRDVRPTNVLVSRTGQIKLVDFGLAQGHRLPSSPELASATGDFATPAYMSPEQLLGDEIDARTDLFSLGAVLFEMLAGARPFDAPDTRGVTQRIRHDAPTRLSSLAPGVPPGLEPIIERCLEKRPADRFASARVLADELRRVVSQAGLTVSNADVARALVRAGLSDAPAEPAGSSPLVSTPAAAPRREGVGRAATGQLVVLAAMVLGAGVLHARGHDEGPNEGEHAATLELVPDRAAYVRVLARPWAQVFVDGQLIDTTPVARAIPLPAGLHQLHFRHPAAPDEQRTLRLAPGETALVEVEMKVPPPPAPPPSAPPASSDTTP